MIKERPGILITWTTPDLPANQPSSLGPATPLNSPAAARRRPPTSFQAPFRPPPTGHP
ncbi:hypothetical protein BCR44DRAFT_1443355 [Catenaria anguillulae PL171]|uniref:Uncharacterized protein n=1 Tax=Catenaria anguillulae PL171 TaxID=765915 RepID=A0A1Y2H8Z2_9FUNG|nr:hypothetical protein BCR44DRAFT_1443355 [Catenaria anguillulae PL171]